MKEFLQSALSATIMSGVFSLLLWLLNRRSAQKDKKNSLQEQLDRIEGTLNSHIAQQEEEKANSYRLRILRFADEVRQGAKHTKEHWEEILSNIDYYEDYCAQHSTYSNNKAVIAIALLKQVYQDLLKENKFL